MYKKLPILIFGFFILVGMTQASRFYFEEPKSQVNSNCPFELTIGIENEEHQTTATNLAIVLDTSKFTVNYFDWENGVFNNYTTPIRAIASHGKYKNKQIMHIMWTNSNNQWFRGKWVFGTLTITPLAGVDDLEIEFYMLPWEDADDSNITYFSGGQMYESLTEAKSIVIPVKKGACTIQQWELQLDDSPLVFTPDQVAEIISIEWQIEQNWKVAGDGSKITQSLNLIKEDKTLLITLLSSFVLMLIFAIVVVKHNKKKN